MSQILLIAQGTAQYERGMTLHYTGLVIAGVGIVMFACGVIAWMRKK